MTNTSRHYAMDRKKRERVIQKIGYGTPVATFIFRHSNKVNAEIHEITSTGIIKIYAEDTHMLITKLIARPGQIRRYYPNGEAPEELIKVAKENVKRGYNK